MKTKRTIGVMVALLGTLAALVLSGCAQMAGESGAPATGERIGVALQRSGAYGGGSHYYIAPGAVEPVNSLPMCESGGVADEVWTPPAGAVSVDAFTAANPPGTPLPSGVVLVPAGSDPLPAHGTIYNGWTSVTTYSVPIGSLPQTGLCASFGALDPAYTNEPGPDDITIGVYWPTVDPSKRAPAIFVGRVDGDNWNGFAYGPNAPASAPDASCPPGAGAGSICKVLANCVQAQIVFSQIGADGLAIPAPSGS